MCVTLCCCQSFKWNTQKLIIKNTKWPPRAHWAAMNPELIFKTNCPVFGLISKLWYHRTLKQPKNLLLKCKVSSIIDNVSQKTNPLKEVNQAVLTSCRSESSSFKFAIYCYSVKYSFPPHPSLLPLLHLFISPVLGYCDFWTRCCLADRELLNGR